MSSAEAVRVVLGEACPAQALGVRRKSIAREFFREKPPGSGQFGESGQSRVTTADDYSAATDRALHTTAITSGPTTKLFTRLKASQP